jgi:hypothetical protein
MLLAMHTCDYPDRVSLPCGQFSGEYSPGSRQTGFDGYAGTTRGG